KTSISGRVLAGGFGPTSFGTQYTGSPYSGLQGVAGVTVTLQDSSGNVVATTTTGKDGSYTFNELDLGSYSVVVSLSGTGRQTTRLTRAVSLTRGAAINAIDFLLDTNYNPKCGPGGF